jgi:release factor glutamine methyltransferase
MPARGLSIEEVVERLAAAGCVSADDEAVDLLAAAPDGVVLEEWLRRREKGEPLAWILGTLLFCGRLLHVDRGVYVPRFQTEELARRAAGLLPPGGRAVDLCTGTGAVAAHLMAEVPTATVLGVDIDLIAATCARRNGVSAIAGDLDQPIRPDRTFDLITAVAPYVPTDEIRFLPRDVRRYEPAWALDGGRDGLSLVKRVVAGAAGLLRPGGWLVMELGGRQDEALRPGLTAAGFDQLLPERDDEGDLRLLAARISV